MTRLSPLLVLLPIQALLLFSNLDLLPAWMDELFTHSIVRLPLNQIVPVLQHDIHPPLYYFLLHLLSLAGLDSLAALRAFSACWALAATALLDLLWTRRWKPLPRWTALALLAFSPCLLLYGRMARSYSMQTALCLLAVWALWRWTRHRARLRLAAAAAAALLALLYTHYVPGMAVAIAFAITMRRALGVRRLALFASAVLAGYLPWLLTLEDALRKWSAAPGFSSRYSLTANKILGNAIEAAYGLTSLSIGETFHVLSLLIVPIVLLLVLRGLRLSPLTPMLLLAALFGYVAVAHWVSYPFIPARLLWLLPFAAMAAACARPPKILLALICLSFVSSAAFYFARVHYLNMGYQAPVREIAARIDAQASPNSLVLIDAYNTDAPALRFYLRRPVPALDLTPAALPAAARDIFIVRNERDISPGALSTALESQACAGRARSLNQFLPLEPWHKLILKTIGIQPPEYFYRLTICQSVN